MYTLGECRSCNAMVGPCSLGLSIVKFCTKCRVLVLTLSELKHLDIGCYHALNTVPHDNFLIILMVKASFMKRQKNELCGRGGSRIFFRRGWTCLLLYFNTNKPHSFSFCRIPVVLENRRSSREGRGCVPPAPSPSIRPCVVFAVFSCTLKEEEEEERIID